MSEAEDLLIEASLRTALVARELWQRYVPRSGPLALSAVRWRIELFLTAVYGPCPMIVPADPPLERTLLQALLHRRTPERHPRVALASTDGFRIHVPRSIEPSRGDAADLALFRLFALEMAARVQRGTHAWLPDAAICRDLFLVAEAVAVDAQLLRDVPGLAGELAAERARALAMRPRLPDLPAREAGVEAWVQRALSSEPAELARSMPPTAADSLAWAQEQARTLAGLPGRYRGIVPVPLWGRVERAAPPLSAESPSPPSAALAHGPRRVTQLRRTPRARAQSEDSDPQPGAFVVKPNAAQQSVEDPQGLSRPAERELTPDIADIAAALAELPEAQLVRTHAPTREVLCADALPLRAAAAGSSAPPAALSYPEWDHARGTYRVPGARVHERAATLGDADAARAALARHAALVCDVRRRFERLRLRPRRSTRQLDGDELDLTAAHFRRKRFCPARARGALTPGRGRGLTAAADVMRPAARIRTLPSRVRALRIEHQVVLRRGAGAP